MTSIASTGIPRGNKVVDTCLDEVIELAEQSRKVDLVDRCILGGEVDPQAFGDFLHVTNIRYSVHVMPPGWPVAKRSLVTVTSPLHRCSDRVKRLSVTRIRGLTSQNGLSRNLQRGLIADTVTPTADCWTCLAPGRRAAGRGPAPSGPPPNWPAVELRHVALERPALLEERSAAAEELVALFGRGGSGGDR
ncbi:hypothetical protein [Pseudonocardia sp.]|jgi:hypothetical protein|uniref:hypothetical protein n=1 Tax=Pseudonocardia sp. TaxID=60912 RepID=UPI0031FC5121